MKKRIGSIALVVVMLLTTCLVGCGKKNEVANGFEEGKINVEIGFWFSGLGIDFLDALIEGFEKKHPEYNVYYNETAILESVTSAFGVPEADTVDLYMAGKPPAELKYLEALNDVLESTIDGESKTIKEKFHQSYLDSQVSSDGNFYGLTYGGGVLGFVYNEAIFKEAGVEQLPRTSNELAMLSAELYEQGITPFCHYNTGYWLAYAPLWWAQYDGIEKYNDFYVNPSKDKFIQKDGRYEMLKAFEKCFADGYILQGSNTEGHTVMQTKFIDGQCAMMINGSWLQNEMNSADKMADFKMMRNPVLSSIVKRLTTVKIDKDLREVVTAIDNIEDGVEKIEKYKDGDNYKVGELAVSAADWDIIREARHTAMSVDTSDTAYIPSYSDSKEGAKEFLKYMYSDEGLKIYADSLHMLLPLDLDDGEYNTEGWTAFELSLLDMYEESEVFVSTETIAKADPLFISGGAAGIPISYVPYMSSSNKSDRINTEEAWKRLIAEVNKSYDDVWMKNIK